MKFLENYEERKPTDRPTEDVVNAELRRSCYEKAVTFFHRRKWYPQDDPSRLKHVALPSCIVWAIRRRYEDTHGKYSGFPPKSELLQKVADAHNKFTQDTEVYDSIVDMANPKDGLLTTLQKLNQNTSNSVLYDTMQQHGGLTSSAGDNARRWTESANKGIQLLPSLGIVACATAFEACVQDAIRRCLDVLFPTSKVSTADEKFWIAEFKKWTNNRVHQSQFWPDEVHESEISFWTALIPALHTRVDHSVAHSKHVLERLQCFPKKVFQHLMINPTSQIAVGLIQEMTDARKQETAGKLQCPTFSCIQQIFRDIVLSMEAARHKEWHRKTHEKSTTTKQERRAKKRKTEREQDLESTRKQEVDERPSVASMTRNSRITDNISTPESSIAEITKSLDSTLPRSIGSGKGTESPQTEVITVTEDFLEYLITDYANMYHWQIWLHGEPKNVKCKISQSLKYLSNLFYGMRCIFSHGSPRKTVEFGAMGVGRRPSEACDFDIDVLCPAGRTKEQRNRDKELCESYLFRVVTDATQRVNEMQVDFDLFKSAKSFYEYVVKIIGRVAACIIYTYSDVKTTEKATHENNQDMQEIQQKTEAAWKWAKEVSRATNASDAEEMEDIQQEPAVYRWTSASVSVHSNRIRKMHGHQRIIAR